MANDVSFFKVQGDATQYSFNDADLEAKVEALNSNSIPAKIFTLPGRGYVTVTSKGWPQFFGFGQNNRVFSVMVNASSSALNSISNAGDFSTTFVSAGTFRLTNNSQYDVRVVLLGTTAFTVS